MSRVSSQIGLVIKERYNMLKIIKIVFFIVSAAVLNLQIQVAYGQANPRVLVRKQSVSLLAVSFGGNIALRKDNGTKGADGTGVTYMQPEIVVQGKHKRSSPVCYAWSTKPVLTATFVTHGFTTSVSAPVSVTATESTGATLTYTGTATLGPGGGTATVTTSNSLTACISNTTFQTTWIITLNGSNKQVGTSSNKMYVTEGAPYGSPVTRSRVNWVTQLCNQKNTTDQIVKCLWDNFFFNAQFHLNKKPNPVWRIADNEEGECIDIIECMILAVKMTGASPFNGQVVYCYPSTNASHAIGGFSSTSPVAQQSRNSTNGNTGHTNNLHVSPERLYFHDNSAASGNKRCSNNWECCLYYTDAANTSVYYAGGGGGPYTSPFIVMHNVVYNTYWAYDYVYQGVLYGVNCANPGPYPEQTYAAWH